MLSDDLRAAVENYPGTRVALCDRAGIDQTALSHFMAGRRGLSLSDLDRLVDALGLRLTSRRTRHGNAAKRR